MAQKIGYFELYLFEPDFGNLLPNNYLILVFNQHIFRNNIY